MSIVLGLVLGAFLSIAHAQEIHLDKMQKCGELLCYPSLKESDVFYYLPDRPRLAVKDGKPQFSFLKYARVQETGEAGTGRAEGGGIVHFLVTYGADAARVRAAENALRETQKNARIAGPIVYRKGSFALVTSFQEGEETLTRTVAVGRAPLMEGQKAAVSMALTREGAELLWESFQSDTPDISLVFDMEFAGIREPYEATLEADWERVSKHHRLQVGGRYAWFGADVDMLFQELRQTGAVKITTKGEHAAMDKILDSAHNKLLSVMFDPAPDELTRMAAEKGSHDNLNQAIKLLKGDGAAGGKTSELTPFPKPEHRVSPILLALQHLVHGPPMAHAADNPDLKGAQDAFKKARELYVQEEFPGALEWFKQSLALVDKTEKKMQADLLYNIGVVLSRMGRCDEAMEPFLEGYNLYEREETKGGAFYWVGLCLARTEKAELGYEALTHLRAALSILGEQSETGKKCLREIEAISAKIYHEARHLDEGARSSGYEPGPSRNALAGYRAYLEGARPSDQRANEVEGRIRFLESKIGEKEGGATATSAGRTEQAPAEAATASKKQPETPEKTAEDQDPKKQVATALADKLKETLAPAEKKTKDEKKPDDTKKPEQQTRKKDTPGFSLVASYQMKNIKRSGKMVYQMNHYRTEMQAFAMTENIGDLYRRYGRDPRVFRAVNIDDPVFKQREILVTLDGQDSETFSRHMNFVTVQMKKRHQSGDLTTDEVVITPERFNQSGNAFNLLYGWKGDNDREAWLNYAIETLWSFHGGMEIRIPSSTYDSAMVALQPPHRYRTVTVEGEGEALNEAQVRHAVVTFTSYVGGKPITTEATIRNQGPASSMIVDIPEDRIGMPTRVGITWYLRGGKTVTAPPRDLEGDIIYWDELPDKEV